MWDLDIRMCKWIYVVLILYLKTGVTNVIFVMFSWYVMVGVYMCERCERDKLLLIFAQW
jgi:hypothetical protein